MASQTDSATAAMAPARANPSLAPWIRWTARNVTGQRERVASHGQMGRAAGCVPGLFCLGWGAGDLRVGVAHLGQGVKLAGISRWRCWVGAEQRERVLGAQLIP